MPDSPDALISPPDDESLDSRSHKAIAAFSPGKVWWSILLSLAVMLVIGYFTYDPTTFAQMIRQVNPWWMVAAVATLAARVFFGGWRLHYISKGRLSLGGGLKGQLAWDFFSNITPSAIGGGPFAAVFISRDRNIRMGDATAFMLFSMLMDQLFFALTIPIVLVASLFIDVIPASLGYVGLWTFMLYFAAMLTWVVLFGYATMYRPELLETLAGKVFRIRGLRRFRDRALAEMAQLRRRAKILRSQPPRFYAFGLLLTVASWLSRYVLLLFIVWSIHASFDKVLLVLRTAALTLSSLIMPTPGGAGGIEGLYALFIGPLMPKAALAPTLFAWRFLGFYLFVAIGIFLSTHHVQQALQRKHAHLDGVDVAANGSPADAAVTPEPELAGNED